MNIENMVKDIRQTWEKEGYYVNSDPASYAIGLMVNSAINQGSTSLEDLKIEMQTILYEKVFCNADQAVAFLGKEKFPGKEYPEIIRGHVRWGVSGLLANDFYHAMIRS